MRVFERIGRMLRADAHGMMDQMEERSLVLRQHLREAEIEVARKRTSIEALDEERRDLREEGQRLESQVASLDADVELARSGDDPELARYAIRRLIPKKVALQKLFARAAELDVRRARSVERLEVQEVQLDELHPRVRANLARCEADGLPFETSDSVTDEEIELELLRRRTMDVSGGSTGTGAGVGRPAEEGR